MQSAKVVLTGNFGVGKTSLFRRFIEGTFSEKYFTTIGVKIDRKIVQIEGESVTLLLWDIEGEVSQCKVPATYFMGASAIIYVVDITRPNSYKNCANDIAYLTATLPNCPIKKVANKIDLVEETDLAKAIESIPFTIDFTTSAKMGDNVNTLFENIASLVLAENLNLK